MSEFSENAGGVLLCYIREQQNKVQSIYRGEVYSKDDPRYELTLRHEADKLELLQNLAKDAGHDGHGFIQVFGGNNNGETNR